MMAARFVVRYRGPAFRPSVLVPARAFCSGDQGSGDRKTKRVESRIYDFNELEKKIPPCVNLTQLTLKELQKLLDKYGIKPIVTTSCMDTPDTGCKRGEQPCNNDPLLQKEKGWVCFACIKSSKQLSATARLLGAIAIEKNGCSPALIDIQNYLDSNPQASVFGSITFPLVGEITFNVVIQGTKARLLDDNPQGVTLLAQIVEALRSANDMMGF